MAPDELGLLAESFSAARAHGRLSLPGMRVWRQPIEALPAPFFYLISRAGLAEKLRAIRLIVLGGMAAMPGTVLWCAYAAGVE